MRRALLGLLLAAAFASPAIAQPYAAGATNQSSLALIAPSPPITANNSQIATTKWVNDFFALGIPLANGKIFIGSVGNLATAQSLSGDCTLVASGVITCTQAAGNFNVIGNLTVGGSIIDGNGLLMTNIVAPATPAAGTTRIYVDSTTKTLSAKNDAGTVSNTVVASVAVANQFMTGISAAGVITRAQPAFTDLSGSASCAQEPARTGDVTAPAGSCANTLPTVNANVGTFGSATQTGQVTVNAKGQVTAATSVTVTPAVGSVTGLGTGVATALAVNTGSAGAFDVLIAKGTSALGTGAITSATCASVVTTAATGTATTDVIQASFNGDPTAVTGYIPSTSGMLTVFVYPSANNVNFKVCNNTTSSITPGAITLNWKVTR